MKRNLLILITVFATVSFTACGGGKESASSIAAKWCELNGKAHKAAEGPEKEAAEVSLQKFENELEAKYKTDEAFYKQIQQEVEKCEDASEGR